MSSNETIEQAVMAGMGLAFLSHTVRLELRAASQQEPAAGAARNTSGKPEPAMRRPAAKKAPATRTRGGAARS